MEYQIHNIENKLQELRSLILIFKGESAIWLTNAIINLDIKRVELSNGNRSLFHLTNAMTSINAVNQRAYWAPGQPVGAPVSNFWQIQYFPLPNALIDLDQALSGALVDCGSDIHKQVVEFKAAAKVWITVQVRYEPAKPDTDKREAFDQYLSATATRIFKRDGQITSTTNPYTDSLQILTNRIKEFNAKFIKDKSGLRMANVLQLVLKIVKYQPREGSKWQFLPKYSENKKAIINIRNNDQRCFGYALLYFLERTNLFSRNFFRPSIYKEEMFYRYELDALPYPISPNYVHMFEDTLQMNINVFSFFDDEGRARHPLVISRKNYTFVANRF